MWCIRVCACAYVRADEIHDACCSDGIVDQSGLEFQAVVVDASDFANDKLGGDESPVVGDAACTERADEC